VRILTVSAEAAPFAKTGGLADVATAFTKALAEKGHEVALILPKYLMTERGGFRSEPIDIPLMFRIGNDERTGWIHRSTLPGTNIPVYFVVNDHYFNRNGIYQEEGKDYPDNLARFTFFCRSVLELLRSDEFPAEIIHCHDWQTSLIPAYLKTVDHRDPALSTMKTVFTVHNLAYQGFFPRDQYYQTGLPWEIFNPGGIEFYGDLNLLKAGLVYSDWITTVSERYAAEMMTPANGRGLESVVYANRERLTGILNGADYTVWNPETDTIIKANYSPHDLAGKLLCKEDLQREMKLPVNSEVPLMATVCRFDEQKGIDLMCQVLDYLLLGEEMQFIALGTGKPEFERMMLDLMTRFPRQVGVHVGINENLAHKIQAGADLFLMPSKYEPCGLSQLYSMKYGTPPVVHLSGGLADTVRDYNDAQKDGYGFVFYNHDQKDFLQAINRAIAVYRDKTAWDALRRRGMACDFSWGRSASRYEEVYRDLLEAPV
jgi:starch synthase